MRHMWKIYGSETVYADETVSYSDGHVFPKTNV
jgi:hypothetical protein